MKMSLPQIPRTLLVIVTILLTFSLSGAPMSKRGKRPNIIFIMVDDMGYHDLGCYGSKTIHTPNIDRMAAEGLRFTDCYSGDAVCAGSRSTLMTGLHKGHTPVRGNSGGIPLFPEDITIAEVLKKAGYITGGFGKWGLGGPENAIKKIPEWGLIYSMVTIISGMLTHITLICSVTVRRLN